MPRTKMSIASTTTQPLQVLRWHFLFALLSLSMNAVLYFTPTIHGVATSCCFPEHIPLKPPPCTARGSTSRNVALSSRGFITDSLL